MVTCIPLGTAGESAAASAICVLSHSIGKAPQQDKVINLVVSDKLMFAAYDP
jgi:hypothetical protein